MRLINRQNGKPLVEFKKERTIFYSKFLELEMKRLGISIPHGMRAFFEGKDSILYGDPHFQEAFKEVYYLTSINHDLFKWEE